MRAPAWALSLASVAWVAGCNCSAAPVLDAAVPSDGEITDSGEAACSGAYVFHRYVFDGVEGNTGCVPGIAGTTINRSLHMRYTLLHFDLVILNQPDGRARVGLPPGVCWTFVKFYNVAIETGGTGTLEYVPERLPPDLSAPLVGLWTGVGWDGTTLFDNCRYEADGGIYGRGMDAVMTGGTWHVIQGGDAPGDWIDVEARDVTFEPFGGHTLRFERMHWHVQLGETVVIP